MLTLVVLYVCMLHCTHIYSSSSFYSAMKKMKHRIVEKMNDSTADSLGLSRAVLVNG